MNYRTNIKEFFLRYKRLLLVSSALILAVVMIAIVASNTTRIMEEENVQTSAPGSITFVMPVKDGVVIKDYSDSQLKYNSTLKQWEAHKAIDIKGVYGADVYACYNGEVVSVETDYLRGTVITIKHSDSLQTVYASLDENVTVKVGNKVKTGDKIGTISTSAKSEANDGPHLHLEVLYNNVKTDPNLYLENSNK